MGFFSRWRNRPTSLDHWCIAYIDVNPYRLKTVSEQLSNAGVEVKTFEDGIYVRNEQYTQAMGVIQEK
ncbi:MAG TPA: hypothetical protein VJ824_10380 [Bacillota bacterium]|nr:hypothetical protein [Bacillota bacterium]